MIRRIYLMRTLRTFIAAALLMLFSLPSLFAGSIQTKDGSVINGKILSIEEGVIKIEYDAKKLGFFYKKITVFFSNQRKAEKLSIEGFVE